MQMVWFTRLSGLKGKQRAGNDYRGRDYLARTPLPLGEREPLAKLSSILFGYLLSTKPGNSLQFFPSQKEVGYHLGAPSRGEEVTAGDGDPHFPLPGKETDPPHIAHILFEPFHF